MQEYEEQLAAEAAAAKARQEEYEAELALQNVTSSQLEQQTQAITQAIVAPVVAPASDANFSSYSSAFGQLGAKLQAAQSHAAEVECVARQNVS